MFVCSVDQNKTMQIQRSKKKVSFVNENHPGETITDTDRLQQRYRDPDNWYKDILML